MADMSRLDLFIFTEFFTGGTSCLVDNRRNALALKVARQLGCYDEVVAIIKRRRREHLTGVTLWQREWGTKVSRRPQRGRHHDSWAIRESCVRADGSDYSKHLAWGHHKRAEFGLDDSPYYRGRMVA